MHNGHRKLRELSDAESLELLGSVPLGRIVFTTQALPTVRPVNHILDDGSIIIRSHEGAAIVTAVDTPHGAVVAYEADQIDPEGETGWSVVVTGQASIVRDRNKVARYQRILRSWVSGNMDQVIRIRPAIINGFALR